MIVVEVLGIWPFDLQADSIGVNEEIESSLWTMLELIQNPGAVAILLPTGK